MGVEWGGVDRRQKKDRRKVHTAAWRWERFQEREEMYDGHPGDVRWQRSFAERGDGVLVFFDEDGWFTMEWREDADGVSWIYACDPNGTAHEVYCEPVWLAAYRDAITENVLTEQRGEN